MYSKQKDTLVQALGDLENKMNIETKARGDAEKLNQRLSFSFIHNFNF